MSDRDSQPSVRAMGPGSHRQSTSATELLELLERPAWMRDAACREHDLDLFFPGQGGDATTPKRICASCLVRDECDQYAEEHDERRLRSGIWGGRSAVQREKGRPFVAPPPIVEPEPAELEPEPAPHVAPAPAAVAEEAPPRPKRKRLPRHGTHKRWRRGCRCEPCANANREWWAEYRRRRKAA